MEKDSGNDESNDYYYTPALIAKETQLNKNLAALEAMLENVQELRTKVNFERTQLITLMEMARRESNSEMIVPEIRSEELKQTNVTTDYNDQDPRDPLVLLDKLYNGEFCVSEEEEEDDDETDEDNEFRRRGDFGLDSKSWQNTEINDMSDVGS